MVVWISGLMTVVKTTLCNAIYGHFKPSVPDLAVLDGDAVRAAMVHDLGHSEDDRNIQLGRLQRLSRFLTDQEFCVLFAMFHAKSDALTSGQENMPLKNEVEMREFDVRA